MNKVLIIFLAICLIYVHAFVRREAESPKEQNDLESLAKAIEQFAKDINEKVAEKFDPEAMKKGFNDLLDNVNKAINDLKAENEKQ